MSRISKHSSLSAGMKELPGKIFSTYIQRGIIFFHEFLFTGLAVSDFIFCGVTLLYTSLFTGLAVSDFIFCGVTLLYTYVAQYKWIFTSNDFALFLGMYGLYFQNLTIKTSTWLVVILALYRHAAISFPVTAKQHLTALNTLYAVIACFLFWILLYLPMLWSWNVSEVHCPESSNLYVLYPGEFGRNTQMRQAFTHLWAVLGFIIPVIILAYCNIKMIISLHISFDRSSQYTTAQSSQHQRRMMAQRKMTITLVTIVVSFFVLVFPSDLIGYYQFISNKVEHTYVMLNMLITFNALQNINMAINFCLYCVVNSNFRKTIKYLMPKC